jgi:hypothetical protein
MRQEKGDSGRDVEGRRKGGGREAEGRWRGGRGEVEGRWGVEAKQPKRDGGRGKENSGRKDQKLKIKNTEGSILGS